MLYQLFIYPIELLLQTFYTFFMLYLGNPGFAIAGVSIAVTVFTLPLYNITEKWQKTERDTQLAMQPKINKIKTVFKGDERYMILSTYYRQQHYHPVFALRSSFSLLIQVPFFIAAYHFLSHLSVLQGAAFYAIADLGKQDALIKFGGITVNFLPIAMTLINITAGAVYTKGFPLKEKLQLYAMAALFLILLYNSPAGLVFYWTLNNIFSLIKHCIKKTKHPAFVFYVMCAVAVGAAALFVLFFTDKTPIKKLTISCIAVVIVLVPFFVRFMQGFFYPHLEMLDKMPKRRLSIFLCVATGFFLLGGFFIPSALVSTSAQEFSFIDSYTNPVGILAYPLMHSAGIFLVWCVLIYALFSTKVKNSLTYALCVFFLCALVNTFILKGDYGGILSNLHFDTNILKTPSLRIFIIDSLIFVLCATAVLFALKYLQAKIIFSVFLCINISLAGIGISDSIKIQKTYKSYAATTGKQQVQSNIIEPVFHLSKTGKNVVVLMLDRAISSFVPLIFNELPETAAEFNGFIWYPNTATYNGHTMMGSPPLYGGYEYTPEKINARDDELLVKKHNEALCVMPRLFAENGFSAIITDASWANYSWVPDNRIFWQWKNVKAKNLNGMYTSLWAKEHNIALFPQSEILKRNFIFFSFFRMLASSLRGALYDDGNWWNPELRNSQSNKIIGLYSVLDYLPELTATDAKQNTFSCIVNELTHENEYLQYPEYQPAIKITNVGHNPFSTPTQQQIYHVNAAALKLVGKWFAYLRKTGVYDNTRIIIISDHGAAERFPVFESFPDTGKLFPAQANSLLMVKDFNANFPVKTDMSFMTTADVPFLATTSLIENPVNPFTGNPLSDNEKNSGITYYTTHRFVPEAHRKNTFILDDEAWHVETDLFKPENWRKVQ